MYQMNPADNSMLMCDHAIRVVQPSCWELAQVDHPKPPCMGLGFQGSSILAHSATCSVSNLMLSAVC